MRPAAARGSTFMRGRAPHPGMRAAALVVVPLLLAGCALAAVERVATEGEWLEFRCFPYSPCARVFAEAPGGARGYHLTLSAELRGGYAVEANVSGSVVGLGGHGFGPDEVGRYEGRLPEGATAESWRFTFAPLSGERGGKVWMLLRWIRDDGAPLRDT